MCVLTCLGTNRQLGLLYQLQLNSPKVPAKAACSCYLQASKEAQEKQEALLAAVEAQRAVKQTVVPTNKADIIAALRTIGEPITLFGEGVVSLCSRAPEDPLLNRAAEAWPAPISCFAVSRGTLISLPIGTPKAALLPAGCL